MPDRIQIRRGSNTEWIERNPVLANGELGFNTTTNEIKIGNGQDTWSSLYTLNNKELNVYGVVVEIRYDLLPNDNYYEDWRDYPFVSGADLIFLNHENISDGVPLPGIYRVNDEDGSLEEVKLGASLDGALVISENVITNYDLEDDEVIRGSSSVSVLVFNTEYQTFDTKNPSISSNHVLYNNEHQFHNGWHINSGNTVEDALYVALSMLSEGYYQDVVYVDAIVRDDEVSLETLTAEYGFNSFLFMNDSNAPGGIGGVYFKNDDSYVRKYYIHNLPDKIVVASNIALEAPPFILPGGLFRIEYNNGVYEERNLVPAPEPLNASDVVDLDLFVRNITNENNRLGIKQTGYCIGPEFIGISPVEGVVDSSTTIYFQLNNEVAVDIDRVTYKVTDASVGAKLSVSLYTQNDLGIPTNKIADLGMIDCSTNGVAYVDISRTLPPKAMIRVRSNVNFDGQMCAQGSRLATLWDPSDEIFISFWREYDTYSDSGPEVATPSAVGGLYSIPALRFRLG